MWDEILQTERRPDGVRVRGKNMNGEWDIAFTYDQLISQRVNALDLLDHPNNYKIDRAERKIAFR